MCNNCFFSAGHQRSCSMTSFSSSTCRFGDISLQERINQRNFETLESYYKSLTETVPLECECTKVSFPFLSGIMTKCWNCCACSTASLVVSSAVVPNLQSGFSPRKHKYIRVSTYLSNLFTLFQFCLCILMLFNFILFNSILFSYRTNNRQMCVTFVAINGFRFFLWTGLPSFRTQTDVKELLETLGQNVVTKKRKNVEILWIAGTVRAVATVTLSPCQEKVFSLNPIETLPQ